MLVIIISDVAGVLQSWRTTSGNCETSVAVPRRSNRIHGV